MNHYPYLTRHGDILELLLREFQQETMAPSDWYAGRSRTAARFSSSGQPLKIMFCFGNCLGVAISCPRRPQGDPASHPLSYGMGIRPRFHDAIPGRAPRHPRYARLRVRPRYLSQRYRTSSVDPLPRAICHVYSMSVLLCSSAPHPRPTNLTGCVTLPRIQIE